MNIEPLESRIAPASVTYTDIDGDLVKITASTGPLVTGDLTLSSGDPTVPALLWQLNLSDPGFKGANITFTVTKSATGDGLADVGYINANAVDLGNVTVKGDLGRIIAGNGNDADGPSLKTLSVRSMGAFGLATQDAGSLVSTITGQVGALKVSGDVKGAVFQVTGSLGPVTLGGSLDAGNVFASDDIGPVKIGRDILGGGTDNSGLIQAVDELTSVTVGGFVKGGPAAFTGAIRGGVVGPVKIGRDVIGGSGSDSGSITSAVGALDNVTLGGSLRGGVGVRSGSIEGEFEVGAVKIGGDVQGGVGNESGSVSSNHSTLASLTIGGSLIGNFGGTGRVNAAGIGAVKIGLDLRGGFIDVSGEITSVTIGGSLIGGSTSFTGMIRNSGDMGPVKIGHDVQGGSASNSGRIECQSDLADVSIGGSLLGGSNASSGEIFSQGDMGAVKIGRDLQGGSGLASGLITSSGTLGSVTIGGSVIGGSNTQTGEIFSDGDMGAVKIGGNLTGGSITGSAALDSSGVIQSFSGRIASVTIGGSVIAGVDNSSGSLDNNASIRAGDDIGAITVKGSLVGSVGSGGDITRVIISAKGQASPTGTTDLAIGKISIGGRVEHAQILAGYSPILSNVSPANGNAQIGAVTVGGDWVASDLVAGVRDDGAAGFGDAGDTIIAPATPATSIAKIASIVIKGIVVGTAAGGDHYGFVSHTIGSFKAAGFTAPLTTAAAGQVFELSPSTTDVTVREI